MGLRQLRNTDPGSGAGAGDRQGIPTAGLLAHVMIAKFADHLPLYRQQAMFGGAGLAVPRSTLAQWVGAWGVQLQPLVDALREVVLEQPVVYVDETPVKMLMPGTKKTYRSYVWAYATSPFCEPRLWLTTSASAGPASMCVTSCKTGRASWSAMISPFTRPASNSAWRLRPLTIMGVKPDTALGAGAQELALCWVATQRQTRRGDHKFDPVGPQQWARPVCLAEGCADAPAYAAREWGCDAAAV